MRKPSITQTRRRAATRAGFSLVELLVVMGVIIALGGISITAFQNITRSTQLSSAAQGLTEQLNAARQAALTRQQRVAFCFYAYTEGKGAGAKDFRAAQWFVWENAKGWKSAGSKTWLMPNSTILNSDEKFSNLLTKTDQATPEAPEIPQTLTDANSSVSMRWFSFLPDGSTTLSSDENWYVTLQPRNDPANGGTVAGLPPNFVTLGLDPVTGRYAVYRP